MHYRARAPLRIDFGGGWTDVPFYAEEHGGAVLNAAITRYAHGTIVQPSGSGAINRLRGTRSGVTYTVDAPAGSGLGTSAAQTVLWVTLVKTPIANISDRAEIAEIACQIAALLGIVGGKQDEYASALGGISYFTFRDTVGVERLELDRAFVEELHSRLVLVYTGASRISSSIHRNVWSRYRQGDVSVLSALHRLRDIAGEMREALLTHDLTAFGRLLGENWTCQKALDSSVSYRELDDVMTLAGASGAVGGKACGAGGGGCLVFLAAEGQETHLRSALERAGLRSIPFDFDTYGVHLKKA